MSSQTGIKVYIHIVCTTVTNAFYIYNKFNYDSMIKCMQNYVLSEIRPQSQIKGLTKDFFL
jgi:hypothetical protein